MMMEAQGVSTAVGQEDSFLIVRVREGDIEALGELYERYKTKVYRTAIAITRDGHVAEDILQEVFLRVNRYAGSFDETQPFEPWIYRMTVNLSYSWANKAKRWVHFFQGAVERLKAPSARDPESVTAVREQRELVRRAIDRLPEPHRVAVILYYLEGLEVSEIALALEVPEGTVKSRLYYAREKLREAIAVQPAGLSSEVVYDFT